MNQTSQDLITDRVVSTAERIEGLSVSDLEDEREDGMDPLDPLDIKATVTARGDITEMALVVATGGPHIEVNLYNDTVVGYWAGDEHTAHYRNEEVSDYLFDYYWQFFDDIVLA